MEKSFAVFVTCLLMNCVLQGQEINPIFQDLMTFHPEWITRSVTSHDPTGGNGDGSGNGTPQEGAYRVLFHGKGEGRITRIWMTADLNNEIYNDWAELWIITDGKTFFRGTPLDFFQGKGSWSSPLVMDFRESSGGFLSSVPISYKSEAKVLLRGVEHYFHVTYREGTGSSQGPTAEDAQEFLKDSWWKNTVLPTSTSLLQNQVEKVLAQGPGVVTSIALQLPKENLKNLTIQIGTQEEIPLAFFFGLATSGEWRTVQSSLNYINPTLELLISRLPIPLQVGETLKIRNPGQAITLAAGVEIKNTSMPSVHLVTSFKEQDSPGTGTMSFYESRKPTQYIGLVESIEGGGSDRVYLEGDEMIRTHSMNYPLYLGTGTEDFFNGGWYFSGPHSNPMSGEPLYIDAKSPTHSLYRYMIFDPIVSQDDMRFGFEAGEKGDYRPAHYKTLSLAYEFDGFPKLLQFEVDGPKMVFKKGTVKKESLILDAEAQELPTEVEDLWSRGQITSEIPCVAQGKILEVTRTFNDYKANQEAEVFINGQSRGHFFEAVGNPQRALSQDLIKIRIKVDDCKDKKMSFSLKSRHDFSSIHYHFNYY